MHINVCKLTLKFPTSHSLKDKRQLLQSLCTRIRNQFKVAVAETNHQDDWQLAEIGIAVLSNNHRVNESTITAILNFIEHEIRANFELINCEQTGYTC